MRERTGSRLTAFELMPRFGIDLQLKHGMLARDPSASVSPWYALIEVNRMKGGVPGGNSVRIRPCSSIVWKRRLCERG